MLTKTQALGRYTLALEKDRRLTASMRACAAWATLEEHDKILDMACGRGALLAHLSGKYKLTLCGMCDSPEQARIARESLGDADVIPARLEDIPWRDDTFDAALLPVPLRGEEARRCLAETVRVLHTGGQLVMAVPLFRMRQEGELTRHETMRLMQEAGFRDVSFRAAGLCGVIVGWKRRAFPDEQE